MNGKTEYGSYNTDDFIEVDGQLKELTVTITLCEYRNLVMERTRQEKTLDEVSSRLHEENTRNEALRTENEALKAHVDELRCAIKKQQKKIDELEYQLRMQMPETRCATVERN